MLLALSVEDGVGGAVPVPLGVAVPVPLGDTVMLGVLEGEAPADRAAVGEALCVGLAELTELLLPPRESVGVGVAVGEGVVVALPLALPLALAVWTPLPVPAAVPLGLGDCVSEARPLQEAPDTVGEGLDRAVADTRDREGEALSELSGEAEGEMLPEPEMVARELDGERLGEAVGDEARDTGDEALGDGVPAGLREPESVTLPEPETEA